MARQSRKPPDGSAKNPLEASGVVDMIKEKKWLEEPCYLRARRGRGRRCLDRARIRDESAVLSHGRVRGVFARGEEDGGVDGELSRALVGD